VVAAADVDGVEHQWPAVAAQGFPAVDTSQPAAFVRLAHSWIDGEVATQLVYTIWFPERPGEGLPSGAAAASVA
jgi:hypothetical protein